MTRSTRWTLLLAFAAVLAIAAPPLAAAFARGGGGGSGGRKGGKSKDGNGEIETLQRDDAEASADAFRDDATLEPLRLLRAADRTGE